MVGKNLFFSHFKPANRLLWLYVKYIVLKLISPLIFPYWILRGIYKVSPFLFADTYEGTRKPYFVAVSIYLFLLILGGNITLYLATDGFDSGADALKYEYKSIYGYYSLIHLLWEAKGEAGNEMATKFVKTDTNYYLNNTRI